MKGTAHMELLDSMHRVEEAYLRFIHGSGTNLDHEAWSEVQEGDTGKH